MKLYYLQCKQFQFVNGMLFGQVRRAVFWELSKYFWSKDGSARVRFEVDVCVYICFELQMLFRLLTYLCSGAGKQRFCGQTVEISSRQKQDGEGKIICNGLFSHF